MNKDAARTIRKCFPRLFDLIARNFLFLSIVTELDRPKYLYSKLTGQPYFGGLYLASQTWPERKKYMRNAIRSELENYQKSADEFCMIEVGSWAGESSVLWANELKKFEGKLLCIDPWEPFIKKNHGAKNAIPKLMDKVLRQNLIFDLFLHNIKASGNNETIIPIRSFSSKILPRLEKNSFNVVYLDGGHEYLVIYEDLMNGGDLVKEGGLLCGDDLEFQYHQIEDKDLLNKNRHKEFINCEKINFIFDLFN